MSWKEVRATYLERDGDFDGKNVEDLIARRVLEGMGFKSTHIGRLERALCGESLPDETLWQRTERVFTRALQTHTGQTRAWINSWKILAQETDPQHKAVLERMDMLKEVERLPEQLPLVFARIKDSTVALAFVYWDSRELADLKPPYKVVDSVRICGYDGRLIVQELPAFVRGLADYRTIVGNEEVT